jgi:hypothetical protein
MSSKPQPDSLESSSKGGSESAQRQSLPFEPAKNRKRPEKTPKTSPVSPPAKATPPSRPAGKQTASQTNRSTTQEAAIPDVVSKRMVKRMALLCGVPTALGMSTFVISYLLRINDLFEVPTYAVLLVSLGWFGLGVLGLSYGVLSASWDEEAAGSLVGWSEFTTNWQRMMGARRSSKDKS